MHEWIAGQDQYNSDDAFASLNPIDGKINGGYMYIQYRSKFRYVPHAVDRSRYKKWIKSAGAK